jgi:hypothetical protein
VEVRTADTKEIDGSSVRYATNDGEMSYAFPGMENQIPGSSVPAASAKNILSSNVGRIIPVLTEFSDRIDNPFTR